jgi:hypothetical protein
MTAPEAKLAIIRKLLAQAEDAAASPQEAETFTAKAAELMARYGVGQAMLADAGQRPDAIGEQTISLDPPYSMDKFELIAGIGLALGLRVLRETRWEGDRKQISAVLFGFGSDLERTEILFTSLLLQAVRGVAAAAVPGWENKSAYRRAWLAGFSASVSRRLAEAERRAKEEVRPGATPGGRSVALVLADRQHLIEQRFAEAYPHVSRAKHRVLSGSGMEDGTTAGNQADLGRSRLSRRKARLGR